MQNFNSDMMLEVSQEVKLPSKNYLQRGIMVNEVDISLAHSRKVNRKSGSYITISPTQSTKASSLVSVVANSLSKLVRRCGVDNGKVLIVGLGNKQFVVDALGNMTLDKIKTGGETFYKCKLSPQVSHITGIISYDIIKGVISSICPSLVIAIDTLATNNIMRLGQCYQLTTSGISPGGGVGNPQPTLDKLSLGVPIIAIGVPMIINVGAIYDSAQLPSSLAHYMVTPRDIDALCDFSSDIIANAINESFK